MKDSYNHHRMCVEIVMLRETGEQEGLLDTLALWESLVEAD
jgi:hypothetical protein